MSLNIEEFKGAILSGIPRGNKFMVELPPIPGARVSSQDLNLLCRACSMPLRQMLTSERSIGSIQQKVTYGFATADVSFSFLENNEFKIREYFEQWQKAQFDNETFELKFKKSSNGNGYAKRVVIHQLDNAGLPNYSVELIDAFPTTLGQIDFGNDNSNLLEITVNMAFHDWKSIIVTPTRRVRYTSPAATAAQPAKNWVSPDSPAGRANFSRLQGQKAPWKDPG